MNKTLTIAIVAVIIIGGYFVYGYLYPAGISYAPQTNEPGVYTPPGYTQSSSVSQPATSTPPSASAKTWNIDCKNGAFVPSQVSIKKSDTVTWTNVNCSSVWPASGVHPTHNVYPQHTGACALIGGSDFDACHDLKVGESWSFRFDYVGAWKFHDHLHPQNNGTVNVSQ